MSPPDTSSTQPSDSSAVSPAVTIAADELIDQCELKFTRRGGPGGQHRNKVSSAVVLKHRASGITAEASERRSQADNRAVAIGRLRVELALQLRQDVSGFTQSMVDQYGGAHFRVSVTNDKYPVILADVLNRILELDGEVTEAAEYWRTTASQIIRFLRQEPRALRIVNQKREQSGRHRLK